jgi:hypothetical protein
MVLAGAPKKLSFGNSTLFAADVALPIVVPNTVVLVSETEVFSKKQKY